jgi:hypothetical protein
MAITPLACASEGQGRLFLGNWSDDEEHRRQELGMEDDRPQRVKYRTLKR